MNSADVSDLEEGEILEYDTLPSSYSRDDFRVGNWSLESSVKENRNGCFGLKENLHMSREGKDGYMNRKLKEKLSVNDRRRENKPIVNTADLESISSEGEYKSDDGDKYSVGENEYQTFTSGEMKKRKKRSSHFYGAVEDIMSEIGETICRKSRCNYKKRKSKELKQNLDKCSSRTYDLWRREIFSSHLKSKKRKRKESFCDSDSDLGNYRTERRKKKKKKEVSYEEEETAAKKLKLRDFDEMRQNLLEKLKKQKAEEELKESARETPLELENSEIQEIDMLIDCTNYVDNPPLPLPDSGNEGRGVEEKEGEDELDLIKLRLIALASNKKRKVAEDPPNTENSENFPVGEKSACSREEVDLDRNELLLRAEALKTALLKKHQKRLNKLKTGKGVEVGCASIKEAGSSSFPPSEAAAKGTDLEKESAKLDADAWKENVERESESQTDNCSNVHPAAHSNVEMEKNKGNNAALTSNGDSKKMYLRGKTKRKKRRSLSFGNNLKENNEKSEALDEDDSTLRTQLLSDLMRKKSLKDQEKKSVLLDSIQTAANKPSPSTMQTEPQKDSAKPTSGVTKNLLKKINVPKTKKPTVVPKFPKPDIQRIIVHLGSEDSSDEDGTPARPPPEAPAPHEEIESARSGITESTGTSKLAAEVMQAKYERSVEQLLTQARRKIEGEKRLAENTLATPEAVYKHLPPSQRLEYMRLKQKIAERESLKKQKNENLSNLSDPQPAQASVTRREESVESVPQKPQFGKAVAKSLNSSSDSNKKVLSASIPKVVKKTSHPNAVGGFPSPGGGQTKETSRLLINKMKNPTQVHGKSLNPRAAAPSNGLKTAPLSERNFLLLPSSQALLSKLKLLLKKIKIEKMIEENYEKEISKLKNQLGLFEKKKCEQGFKIKKLWEESMKTYKAIQGITSKAKGKVEPKAGESEEKKEPEGNAKSADEGKEVEKKEEKKAEEEEEGKKVSDETETEISKAQRKSDKELDGGDKTSENPTDSTSSAPCPIKYDSPLQVFSKVSDCSTRVDPNVMVCQFDLMGVCKDEECTYQHLRILAK